MSILDRIRQTDTTDTTPKAAPKTAKVVAKPSTPAKLAAPVSYATVLVRPMVTEKAARLNSLNQYVFEIARGANKIMVARAVEKQFGIKPVSVNILNRLGKTRVRGRITGKTKKLRKAIVTLPAGKTITAAEAK
jgi:large subunit ribosomal protein L23